MISRRLFLRNTAAAGAVGATISAPAIIEAAQPAELTAIPTEIYDAIMRWRTAHRAHVKASQDYSASLRAKPIDKNHCDHLWAAITTESEVGPAREAMIVALLGIDGKGGAV